MLKMKLLELISKVTSVSRLIIAILMVASVTFVMSPPSFAGITGKMSGVVIDVKTNDVLVGATIRISGTNITTSTDEDGEFFILNRSIRIG